MESQRFILQSRYAPEGGEGYSLQIILNGKLQKGVR